MIKKQTIMKAQLDAAVGVLEPLRVAISPEYLGLISTTGQAITVISSTHLADADAIAALAACSFAATRQLARVMEDSESTVMLHEGAELNIHIAQVTEDVLLVVCFHKSSEIGIVRLITRRVVRVLSKALKSEIVEGDIDGTD